MGRLGRGAILLLLGGCALYQKNTPYKYPPAVNPGDQCSEAESGRHDPNPCPEGMACRGERYDKHRSFAPGRCELLPGRCTTGADCQPLERCVRPAAASGRCAPAPLVPSPAPT